MHRNVLGAADVDAGRLGGGASPGALHEAGETHAVILAVHKLALLFLQTLVVDGLQTEAERFVVVATVVNYGGETGRTQVASVVRHLRGVDQVPAPEFGRVDAQVLGRHVQQPLAEESSFVLAGSAVGAYRHLVGYLVARLPAVVVDPVGAGQRTHQHRGDQSPVSAHVCADVAGHLGT